MKALLILSFFIHFNFFCQKETVVLQKEKQTSFFGNIAGHSFGDMDYALIWNDIGVNGTNEYTVDGFKIQYGQKEYEILGNTLPDSICKEICRCCSFNGMIFITDITAIHNGNGTRIFLYPLNLTLIRND